MLTQPAIFTDLSVLADATRSRMLLLLDGHELTVGELCSVLQLPQSTVSRHLKTLLDTGWVASRREATSRYYTLAAEDGATHRSKSGRQDGGRRLWTLLREQLESTPGADQDARRLKGVLARRESKSQAFFASAAAQWDKLREDLFGRASHLQVLPALLDPSWAVADLGCGTGQVSAALAPFVRRVAAVDRSGEMLQTAKHRLREFRNVDVSRGELEAVPLSDGAFDAAVLMLVLHHVANPAAALREASRILKPGGRLIVCDMLPHDHEEYRNQMGHVWLGFGLEPFKSMLSDAGLTDARTVQLASAAEAKGPALFVATARKQA